MSADVAAADPRSRADRALELAGAAVLLAWAAAQLFQELVLLRAPPDSDAAASIAFALSTPDRVRAVALYACFLGLPFAYAAVFRRLRSSGWAVAGIALISLFLALELVLRGLELDLVAGWQRDWLARPAARAALDARLATFGAIQAGPWAAMRAARNSTGLVDESPRRSSSICRTVVTGAGTCPAERSSGHVEASGQRIWNLHRRLRRRPGSGPGEPDGRRRDGAAPVGARYEDLPADARRVRRVADERPGRP